MDFTSLRRVKYTLNITKADEDNILAALVGSASSDVANWLRRLDRDGGDGIELKSRTEYLDPTPGQRRFYTRAYPIQSITTLHGDSTGLYTGSESLVAASEYMLDSDRRSVVMQVQSFWPDAGLPTMPRALRLVYIAGLAADPVISTWTKSEDVGGTLAVGKYVRGESTGAIGYLSAAAVGTLSIECLAGRFVEGETIKQYERLDGSAMDGGPAGDTSVTATLTTCTARSLAESHPAPVMATEMHIAHLRKNRENFDNLNVNQDGVSRISRTDLKNEYGLLPEIRTMLRRYENRLVA